jgi:PKD repeat protein
MVASASASAVPTADFTVAPIPVVASEPATFTSTSTTQAGHEIVSIQWDFDSNGTVDATGGVVQHVFASAGTANVTLTVVDDTTQSRALTQQVVVTAPTLPVADFTTAPQLPLAGAPASFTSTASTVATASIASVQWDFENDGQFDASGSKVDHVFVAPGAYTVRVRVVDTRNLSGEITRLVSVNAPPTAAFTAFPTSPLVWEEVTMTSYSSDAEGALADQRWDIDGDGAFDDASGPVVTGAFTAPGDHTVSLQVRDSQGATATVSKTITARAPTGAVAPPPPAAAAPFMTLVSPFPVIRLAGTIVNNGARIRRLVVRAPARSRVYVYCRGAKCPASSFTKVVNATAVRFRALERYLPAGSVLKVLVRRGEQIGKYTSFRIRRKRLPKRIDACLPPYASRGVKCPAS